MVVYSTICTCSKTVSIGRFACFGCGSILQDHVSIAHVNELMDELDGPAYLEEDDSSQQHLLNVIYVIVTFSS